MDEINPVTKTPDNTSTSDEELDSILSAIERVSDNEIERNARVLDNHLLASDRLVVNKAALDSISNGNELIKLALEAAIQNPQ